MSRFTVVWAPDAEDQLAEIWTNAADRVAVTAAANSIDRELGEDPVRIGTADSEGLFRVVRPPLLVLFEVREPDRIVEISYVRRISN